MTDVVVGMAAAHEAQTHLPPADLDRGVGGEHPVRRIDDDLAELVGDPGLLGGDRYLPALAGPDHERDAAFVTPDRRRPEDRIAERVVEVAVRVDHDADGRVRQFADVFLDLARLGVGRTGVDDERLGTAEDQADVLVEERVAAYEDLVADLDPSV